MRTGSGIVAAGILFIAVLALPIPDDVLPSAARFTAAVALLMVTLWVTEAIPLEATALIPLILFPLLGILTVQQSAAPYADHIIFLFLGGFIIARAMERWNLHKRIALYIIRFAGTSPRRLILGFMIATAFLSMWISNTATAMMMVPIAIAIGHSLVRNDNAAPSYPTPGETAFTGCLLLSVAWAASIGGMGTPIGSPPNGIFLAQVSLLVPGAPAIDFFSWLMFGIPLVCLLIPAAWFYLTNLVYPDIPSTIPGALQVIETRMKELGCMSRAEILTLCVFMLTAAAWICSDTKEIGGVIIPGLDQIFPEINDTVIAMGGAFLLFILPSGAAGEGRLMDWKTAAGIPWGILLLFGGGLCLSAAFVKSGLADTLGGILGSIPAIHPLLILLAVILSVSFLSEVASNTAIASIMMPIMVVFGASSGMNPVILMLAAACASSMAFMMPVATPPNAIVYGTGRIAMKDMFRAGMMMNLISAVILVLIIGFLIPAVLGIPVIP
jgi:sodium-dependent dicarboxylate transporter 2/3/5